MIQSWIALGYPRRQFESRHWENTDRIREGAGSVTTIALYCDEVACDFRTFPLLRKVVTKSFEVADLSVSSRGFSLRQRLGGKLTPELAKLVDEPIAEDAIVQLLAVGMPILEQFEKHVSTSK